MVCFLFIVFIGLCKGRFVIIEFFTGNGMHCLSRRLVCDWDRLRHYLSQLCKIMCFWNFISRSVTMLPATSLCFTVESQVNCTSTLDWTDTMTYDLDLWKGLYSRMSLSFLFFHYNTVMVLFKPWLVRKIIIRFCYQFNREVVNKILNRGPSQAVSEKINHVDKHFNLVIG